MRILLTNDDGIDSDGMAKLRDALIPAHDVIVLAPESERSGFSHAMSLKSPMRLRKVGEGRYSCSGTPADCVILSSLGAIPFKPELVISGINRGPNLGTDIVYSGTCAAARQASMHAIPGIAVSLATYSPPFSYASAAAFIAGRLEWLLELWSPECFVNVNVPAEILTDEPNLAFPSRRVYTDSIRSFEAPDGNAYCFLSDGKVETIEESGSDEDVVRRGLIAVSRIGIHPVAIGGGRGSRERS